MSHIDEFGKIVLIAGATYIILFPITIPLTIGLLIYNKYFDDKKISVLPILEAPITQVKRQRKLFFSKTDKEKYDRE